MKSGGPLKRKAPMKRTAGPKPRHKRKAASAPGKRWRSPVYLEWVRSRPCVVTQQPADDVHHLIGVGNLSGMGLTAPDWAVMAVTRESHQLIHESPEFQKQLQWPAIAMTLGKALEEGVLIVNPEYKP